MKRKLLRLLALALCLALLAGCGAQGTAASTPESGVLPAQSGTESAAVEPEEPEEPPYTGPLYEISVGDVRDKLPDFEEMSSAYLKGNASGIYFVAYANSGDFLGYETEQYGYERYLTNSKLMNFPELDEYVFLGTLSGRTLFCNEAGEGLFATDGDGNILYRAPENIKYLYPYDDYMVNKHGREGMLPFYDTETGYDGYLNLEDFSTWELGPEYAVSGYTRNGTPVRGGDIAEYYPFSEGMKAVLYAESTDTFFHVLVDGKTLRDRNGTCYEIPKPDGRPVKAILVFANGLVLLGCKRDEWSCDYYYLQYEDIRPEGFEAGTSDFWPDAMSIHDYDWPE